MELIIGAGLFLTGLIINKKNKIMKTKLSFKQAFMPGLIAAGVSTVVNAILFFIFKRQVLL